MDCKITRGLFKPSTEASSQLNQNLERGDAGVNTLKKPTGNSTLQPREDLCWKQKFSFLPKWQQLSLLENVTQSCLTLWNSMDYQFSSVTQSCPTLCNPMNARPPCPSTRISWNSTHKNTGVSCLFPCPGDLPNPGIKPGCPPLQADSLPSESPGKPKMV